MFIFGSEASSLCLLCNLKDETALYRFFDCHIVQSILTQLDIYFSDDSTLTTLAPQTALFEIFNDRSIAENFSLINHILLTFRLQVYNSCKKHSLNLHSIIVNKRKVKTLEKRITSVSDRKSKIYHKKWNATENKLPV